MKFVMKGKFTSYEDLPDADLPENAVCYEEPGEMEEIAIASVKYSLLGFGLCLGAFFGKNIGDGFDVHIPALFAGWLASYLVLIPHELMHGIWYPNGAEVEIWSALRQGLLFVTSSAPVSRGRFLWMSLFPTLVFGIIPAALYIFLPVSWWTDFLFGFGASNVMHGGGDFLNIHNTLQQVPKKAMVANSGIHTYWWENKDDNHSE